MTLRDQIEAIGKRWMSVDYVKEALFPFALRLMRHSGFILETEPSVGDVK